MPSTLPYPIMYRSIISTIFLMIHLSIIILEAPILECKASIIFTLMPNTFVLSKSQLNAFRSKTRLHSQGS